MFSEYQTPHVLCETLLFFCPDFIVHGTVFHKDISTQAYNGLVIFPSRPTASPFLIFLLLAMPFLPLDNFFSTFPSYEHLWAYVSIYDLMDLHKIWLSLSHHMCIYDFMYPYKIWTQKRMKTCNICLSETGLVYLHNCLQFHLFSYN